MSSFSRTLRRTATPALAAVDRRFDELGHLMHAVKNEIIASLERHDDEREESAATLRSLDQRIAALRDELQLATGTHGDERPPSAAEVLQSAIPGPTAEHRIAMTTRCRDADRIPKVANGGAVLRHDESSVQVMHNGLLVEHGGYYGDWMAEIITALDGHHEPQEELVFHTILERLATTNTPTMIELGCFWAYYSLWFLLQFPTGRAVAVEPDPDHLDVGRRNAELNGLPVEFAQFAAGGRSNQRLALESEIHPGRVHDVAVRSVTDLMADFGLDSVDILHLDIQGAELEVLESCAHLVAARRLRFVVVSTHHHVISDDPVLHRRVLDWLRSHGAHIICEHSIAESFSGDGLVAASFWAEDRDLRIDVSHNRSSTSLFRDTTEDLACLIAAYDQLRS